MKTPFLISAFLACALILSACQPATPTPVACTMDAKICPDGSAVGREGPNCEFAACPEPTETPTPQGHETFLEYKSQDPDMCSRIRYTCDGDEAFSDETGCGCVRKHTDAAVTLCATDYDPVCGWSGPEIQCFAYPCASTFSNLCMASIDPGVASTTPGECPPVGSSPERDYVSTNQTQCAATTWICGEGMQQFYDDTGCGCEPVPAGKLQAIDCPVDRQQACTREYNPVCGQAVLNTGVVSKQTYSNSCTACAEMKVVSYTEGSCSASEMPSDNLNLVMGTQCEDPRPEACTMQYDPVCARKTDGSEATYGNACSACGDAQVEWHSPGECTPADENILK